MPDLFETDLKDGNLVEVKVFWKLVVQVDPMCPDELQVLKIGSLWGKSKENGMWRRYYSTPIDMTKEFPKKIINNGVKCENGVLVFDGSSYIEIKDPGLHTYTELWNIDKEFSKYSKAVEQSIDNPGEGAEKVDSILVLGINIRIEAEVMTSSVTKYNPIFKRKSSYLKYLQTSAERISEVIDDYDESEYRPYLSRTVSDETTLNPPRGLGWETSMALLKVLNLPIHTEIALGLEKSEDNHMIGHFFVSNDDYKTKDYELLDINGSDFHVVVVQQDANRPPIGDGRKKKTDEENKKNQKENEHLYYFEFFADAIQLNEINTKRSGKTVAEHYFSNEESIIFIGYDPDSGESGEFFDGSIKRIVFDPNASCVDC